MSRTRQRISSASMLLLATGAALSLTACLTPPPIPIDVPPQPTQVVDPGASTPAPTPDPSTEPTPDTTAAPAGDIPELVAIGAELPAGALPGWETSIITADGFTTQPDSDFPLGPTISVVEDATGCTVWAYQGTQDSESPDEEESSAATLALISNSEPTDWEADIFTLDASASQGAAVEMLSIIQEPEDGSAQAWFARNFQSSGTTSSIIAECPAGAGGIDHIDSVVGEHLQINFLLP